MSLPNRPHLPVFVPSRSALINSKMMSSLRRVIRIFLNRSGSRRNPARPRPRCRAHDTVSRMSFDVLLIAEAASFAVRRNASRMFCGSLVFTGSSNDRQAAMSRPDGVLYTSQQAAWDTGGKEDHSARERTGGTRSLELSGRPGHGCIARITPLLSEHSSRRPEP
jgi:hypothetical protein